MAIDQNHFMLGDTEFARNEKQAAAIGLMKTARKSVSAIWIMKNI